MNLGSKNRISCAIKEADDSGILGALLKNSSGNLAKSKADIFYKPAYNLQQYQTKVALI